MRKGGTLISSVSVPDAHLAQQCGIEAKFILVDVNTEDLEAVADLLDAQRLVVRIGQVLPLRDAGQAHETLKHLRPLAGRNHAGIIPSSPCRRLVFTQKPL